jgi:hypothetical protein
MPESSEEQDFRCVLLFRMTRICEIESITIETSLFRSELTGNHIIEQTMFCPNHTTTSMVVLNTQTINQLIPHLQRIVTE